MTRLILLMVLAACLVAGIVLARNTGLVDFASNRGKTSTRNILLTNLATLVGGFMFFGLAAIGHRAGVLGFIIGAAYALGLLGFGFLVPRIKTEMEAFNCDTLDDYVGVRYGRTAQGLSTTLNLVFFSAILAAQFIGLEGLLAIFAPSDHNLLFFATAAVVIVYTASAGFRGVLLTDLWQFILVSVAAVVLFGALIPKVGLAEIQSLGPSYFDGTGFGLPFLLAIVFLFPISILVRSDLWQRVAAARDSSSAQRAFFLSAPLLLLFYVILTSSGIFGRVILGASSRPDTSAIVAFMDSFAGTQTLEVLGGVLAIGIFVALMSTADTNLNLIALTASKLHRNRDWREFETQRDASAHSDFEGPLFRNVRLWTVALGIIGVVVARLVPDIVNLIVGAAAAVMVFIPVVLAALFMKTVRSSSATVSLAAGLATLVYFMTSAPLTAMGPAFLAALAGYGLTEIGHVLLKGKTT